MKSDADNEVKIGWSKDIEGRRLGFNRSSLCKSPYEVYYVYMTDEKRRYLKLHNLIDLINETANRFIDELETIEKDISKTKVLG